MFVFILPPKMVENIYSPNGAQAGFDILPPSLLLYAVISLQKLKLVLLKM